MTKGHGLKNSSKHLSHGLSLQIPSPLLFLSNKFCVYIDLQISIGAITFIFVFVVMILNHVFSVFVSVCSYNPNQGLQPI